MKTIKYMAVLIVALLSLNVSAEEALTEDSVNQLLTDFKDATVAKDADKTLALYTEDASVTMTVTLPGSTSERTIELQQDMLRNTIKQSYSMPGKTTSYQYKSKEIEISPDGKSATVNAIIVETMESQLGAMTGETDGVITVVSSGGRAKIKNAKWKVSVSISQSEAQ